VLCSKVCPSLKPCTSEGDTWDLRKGWPCCIANGLGELATCQVVPLHGDRSSMGVASHSCIVRRVW
jgi:hypothetical protein